MAIIRSHSEPWFKRTRWTEAQLKFLCSDPYTARLLGMPGPADKLADAKQATFALPDPSKPLAEQAPAVLLAMLIWGEGRGCGMRAKFGVGQVVVNRVRSVGFPKTIQAVALQRNAFSCFRPDDPNFPKLLRPIEHDTRLAWEECGLASYMVLGNHLTTDPVDGAQYYHDDSVPEPPKDWGHVEQVAAIDNLTFYRQC